MKQFANKCANYGTSRRQPIRHVFRMRGSSAPAVADCTTRRCPRKKIWPIRWSLQRLRLSCRNSLSRFSLALVCSGFIADDSIVFNPECLINYYYIRTLERIKQVVPYVPLYVILSAVCSRCVSNINTFACCKEK